MKINNVKWKDNFGFRIFSYWETILEFLKYFILKNTLDFESVFLLKNVSFLR